MRRPPSFVGGDALQLGESREADDGLRVEDLVAQAAEEVGPAGVGARAPGSASDFTASATVRGRT